MATKLIESINADDLPTNVFTIEDKDPMVILGKLNEVIANLETLTSTINSTDSKADTAITIAQEALNQIGAGEGTKVYRDTQLLTTLDIKPIEDNIANINNKIYPIGSIYISTSQVSPASIFGGTWEQLKDRFLLGCGDTYTAGATGGEAAHTLAWDEVPKHSHAYRVGTVGGTDDGLIRGITKIVGEHTNNAVIHSSGSSFQKPLNNMPPYLAVYMWKRTA